MRLASVERPHVSNAARADATALRAHGRLPDSEWARIYDVRLAQTAERLATLLSPTGARLGRVQPAANHA